MALSGRPPPPQEINEVRVVAVGTLAWAALLVGLLVAKLLGYDVHGWWLGMAAYGIGLGLVGILYTRRRRAQRSSARATFTRGPG